jgi:hypothetical protein
VTYNLHKFICQVFPLMFWFKQGLYPGYIIFFVQSALMINGSRGIALPLSICLLLGMLKDYLDLRFDYAFFCQYSYIQMAASCKQFSPRQYTGFPKFCIYLITHALGSRSVSILLSCLLQSYWNTLILCYMDFH